jgi:hypothetical protein
MIIYLLRLYMDAYVNLTNLDLKKKTRWKHIQNQDLKPGYLYAVLYPNEPLIVQVRLLTIAQFDERNELLYVQLEPIDRSWGLGVFASNGLNRFKFYLPIETWKVYQLSRELMMDERRAADQITSLTNRIPGDKNYTVAALRHEHIVSNIGSYCGLQSNASQKSKKGGRMSKRRKTHKRINKN